MATPITIITIYRASIFDPDLLEDGRYVITNVGPINIQSDTFEDGISEQSALFVPNSILAIQGNANYAIDSGNLPDNLEFLSQNGDVLFFVIKGDCDIPLIEATE